MRFFTLQNPLWPVILAFLAVIGYMVSATQFALYQPFPFVSLGLLAGSLGWLVADLRRRRTVVRVLALAFNLALTVLFAWWTLFFSEYGPEQAKVADGDRVARLIRMSMPDHAGIDRPVLAGDQGTLLVLYRGHW